MKHWVLGGGSDVTAPALYFHICPFQFVTAESSSAAVGGHCQQVNIYRICLCPFSAIVWGVGAQCLVPIIGTHTFRETLRPRACAMCPEVHLLRPLAIIVAIVMNGLIVSAGAVLARDAPGCGARCSELSEYKSCLDISNIWYIWYLLPDTDTHF